MYRNTPDPSNKLTPLQDALMLGIVILIVIGIFWYAGGIGSLPQ